MNSRRIAFVGMAVAVAYSTAGAQENMVVKGGFDEDTAGWIPGPAPFQWVSADRNGSMNSGAVEITNDVQRNNQGLSQCFPTEGGTRIEAGAWAFLPADA